MLHALIIEDEWAIALHLEEAVREAGAISVSVAATEREAIELAIARRPDLIASDVRLLEGTGPAAVSTIIRTIGPRPVVFFTAWPQDCIGYDGSAEIVTKPATLSRLVSVFEKHLHG